MQVRPDPCAVPVGLMHPDLVGLGVVDDPPDAASSGLLRRDDAVEFLKVQVLQIEAAPILGRRVRSRGAVPTRHCTPPCGGTATVIPRAAISSF